MVVLSVVLSPCQASQGVGQVLSSAVQELGDNNAVLYRPGLDNNTILAYIQVSIIL